jgi:hypothetical protein
MWVAVALLGLWSCVHFLDWWLPYMQRLLHSILVSASTRIARNFYRSLAITTHRTEDMRSLDFLLHPAFLACFTAAASRRKT